jgi:hypothetical protein
VDLRAGLDDVERRKLLTLKGLVVQPAASRYTDYGTQAPTGKTDKRHIRGSALSHESTISRPESRKNYKLVGSSVSNAALCQLRHLCL